MIGGRLGLSERLLWSAHEKRRRSLKLWLASTESGSITTPPMDFSAHPLPSTSSLLLVIYKTELLHWWPCPESLVYFLVPFHIQHWIVHLVQLLFFDGLPESDWKRGGKRISTRRATSISYQTDYRLSSGIKASIYCWSSFLSTAQSVRQPRVAKKRPRDLARLLPILTRYWNGRGLSLHGQDDGPARLLDTQKVESCRGKSLTTSLK